MIITNMSDRSYHRFAFDRIDKHIIIYNKKSANRDFRKNGIIPSRQLGFDVNNHKNEFYLRDNLHYHIIVAPSARSIMEDSDELFNIMSYLIKNIKNENLFYTHYGNYRFIFHIPKYHPLFKEQIDITKKFINKLKQFAEDEKISSNKLIIKIAIESSEIEFGNTFNNSIYKVKFNKIGKFSIYKETILSENRFKYYDDYNYVEHHINDDDSLLKWFSTITPAGIYKGFKSDKEILEFIRDNHEALKKQKDEKIVINLKSNGKDLDKIKKDIENTIKDAFGINGKGE